MMSQSPAPTATSKLRHPRRKAHEVDGIFFARDQLNDAVTALSAAGFAYADMTAVLERHVGDGRRVAVTELPHPGFTEADERQVRTLATSMSGAIGALAALGVTIATGGAAAAAVAAAALVGGSTAGGVYVAKTLMGFDGVVAEEDIILSVRVNRPDDEKRALDVLRKHGAVQIWVQNRRDASAAPMSKSEPKRRPPPRDRAS
jgi:hypothetical protein